MKRISKLIATFAIALASFPAPTQTVVEYVHTDALGSPVAVTDANQNVVQLTEYEPYGLQADRPVQDGPGYTGHVSDAATGLSYMQQRYYDSTIGKFLSVDPVTANKDTGANFNRYKYANNNPYRFIDPDGRYDCQASKTQCRQFERGMVLINRALANARGNAKTLLTGIVKTLGTRNDGNGVIIKDTSKHAGSWDGRPKGGILNVNFSLLNDVASSLGQRGQDFMVAATTVHEGWHGRWEQLSRAAGTYEVYSTSFSMNDERRAGISEGVLAQGLRMDHPQGFWTRGGGFDMGKIDDQAAASVRDTCRYGCGP